MSDAVFLTLPRRVQRAIDDVFDSIANPDRPSNLRRSKRRKVSVETGFGGGGFLVDDDPPISSSGSIPDAMEEAGQVALDLIPSALQRLDLPPDDEEVLSIFRNAASGWTSLSIEPLDLSDSSGKYVGRDDWRAVCAVLLENHPLEDVQGSRNEDDNFDSRSDEYVEDNDDDDDDELSLPSFDGEDTDDYGVRPSRRTRPTKGKGGGAFSLDEIKAQSNTLTKRQRQTCLATFTLFFPDVPPSELESQRIMIKDIQRVAKLLNEKLKADEARGYRESSFL